MNVQYGCGLCCPPGWVNYDASPTLRLQKIPFLGRWITHGRVHFPKEVKYGDIVKGLPVKKDSCDMVYCSHVLEHLSLNDLRTALKNTYQILNDGGVFRLVLPDFEFCIREYVDDKSDGSLLKFFRDTDLGLTHRSRGVLAAMLSNFANSRHFWMWDYKGLARELNDVGFKKVRRAYYGDSELQEFVAVETKDRWFNQLGIECVK